MNISELKELPVNTSDIMLMVFDEHGPRKANTGMISLVQWNPVDKPPATHNGERYLVVLTDGSVDVAEHYGGDYFVDLSTMRDPLDVLYWADYPESPRIVAQKVESLHQSLNAEASLLSSQL